MLQIERLAELRPVHQRQAAGLALRRWRAPALAFAWDAEWGVDTSVLESLFRLAAEPAGEQLDTAYGQALAELCAAPLFTSEADPDTVRLVQLEAVGGLLAFGQVLEQPDLDGVERIVGFSSGLATYLDALVDASFYSHPSEEAHREFLANLADRTSGRGYFAARNLVVESACHSALRAIPDSEGLLAPATRQLLALCDDFGEELVATLRWLRVTGQ
nr:hypothetical protein OH826_34300 [Streptomyces sp. NBC_00899]